MYLLLVLAEAHSNPFNAPQSDRMVATVVVNVLISTFIVMHSRSSHLSIPSGFLLRSVYVRSPFNSEDLTL